MEPAMKAELLEAGLSATVDALYEIEMVGVDELKTVCELNTADDLVDAFGLPIEEAAALIKIVMAWGSAEIQEGNEGVEEQGSIDEENENEECLPVCLECSGSIQDTEPMIICDGCQRELHLRCSGLAKIPEAYFCRTCERESSRQVLRASDPDDREGGRKRKKEKKKAKKKSKRKAKEEAVMSAQVSGSEEPNRETIFKISDEIESEKKTFNTAKGAEDSHTWAEDDDDDWLPEEDNRLNGEHEKAHTEADDDNYDDNASIFRELDTQGSSKDASDGLSPSYCCFPCAHRRGSRCLRGCCSFLACPCYFVLDMALPGCWKCSFAYPLLRSRGRDTSPSSSYCHCCWGYASSSCFLATKPPKGQRFRSKCRSYRHPMCCAALECLGCVSLLQAVYFLRNTGTLPCLADSFFSFKGFPVLATHCANSWSSACSHIADVLPFLPNCGHGCCWQCCFSCWHCCHLLSTPAKAAACVAHTAAAAAVLPTCCCCCIITRILCGPNDAFYDDDDDDDDDDRKERGGAGLKMKSVFSAGSRLSKQFAGGFLSAVTTVQPFGTSAAQPSHLTATLGSGNGDSQRDEDDSQSERRRRRKKEKKARKAARRVEKKAARQREKEEEAEDLKWKKEEKRLEKVMAGNVQGVAKKKSPKGVGFGRSVQGSAALSSHKFTRMQQLNAANFRRMKKQRQADGSGSDGSDGDSDDNEDGNNGGAAASVNRGKMNHGVDDSFDEETSELLDLVGDDEEDGIDTGATTYSQFLGAKLATVKSSSPRPRHNFKKKKKKSDDTASMDSSDHWSTSWGKARGGGDPSAAFLGPIDRLEAQLSAQATVAEIRLPAKKLPNYLSQRKPEDLCAYTMPLKQREAKDTAKREAEARAAEERRKQEAATARKQTNFLHMLRARSRDHGTKGREKGKKQESSASEEAGGNPKELVRENYAGMPLSKRDAIEAAKQKKFAKEVEADRQARKPQRPPDYLLQRRVQSRSSGESGSKDKTSSSSSSSSPSWSDAKMTMQDWHAARNAKIEATVAAEKAAAAAAAAAVADRKGAQALARAASIKERLERKREAAAVAERERKTGKEEAMRQKKQRRNCPGKHGLVAFKTHYDGYECSKCGQSFGRKTSLFGCRECDFDLCSDCYEPPSVAVVQVEMQEERYSGRDASPRSQKTRGTAHTVGEKASPVKGKKGPRKKPPPAMERLRSLLAAGENGGTGL